MAKKTKDKVNGTTDASIPDVRDHLYPEGVPKNDDGSVASEEEITVDDARRAGAVTPESAQQNRSMARKIHRKNNGEKNIAWGETNALEIFDLVRQTFSPTSIMIHIQRSAPDIMDFEPIPMSNMRTAQDFYKYLMVHVHKKFREAKYFIRFKEANAMERGRGYLTLPDTQPDANQAPQQGLPVGPPGYPMPPQGMPAPYWPGWPYAAPPQGWQPGPPQFAPPFTPAAPVAPAAPTVTAPPPPQPSGPAPSGYDPWTAATYDQTRRMEEVLRQQSTLLTAALATIDEFKRHVTTCAPMAPSQPQPVAQQLQPVPPGRFCSNCGSQQVAGMRFCGACGTPQVAPVGVGAPQPVVSTAPPVHDPLAGIQQSIGMLSGMMKAVDSIKQQLTSDEEEEDEPITATPMTPPPFKVMPLGAGPAALGLAYNESDGSINGIGTLMTNAPKLPYFLKELAASASELLALRGRPGVAPQRAPAPAPSPFMPTAPRPPAPPPPAPSFMPSPATLQRT